MIYLNWDPEDHQFHPLPWERTPSTWPDCSKPCPAWPWTLPGRRQPQLPWEISKGVFLTKACKIISVSSCQQQTLSSPTMRSGDTPSPPVVSWAGTVSLWLPGVNLLGTKLVSLARDSLSCEPKEKLKILASMQLYLIIVAYSFHWVGDSFGCCWLAAALQWFLSLKCSHLLGRKGFFVILIIQNNK